MHVKTPSTRRAVVDFLREEAPLEYERLKSIGQLASGPPDLKWRQFGSERTLVRTMGPRRLWSSCLLTAQGGGT